MNVSSFAPLIGDLEDISAVGRFGFVTGTEAGLIKVSGLSGLARVGDIVKTVSKDQANFGEVLSLSAQELHVLLSGGMQGVAIGDRVQFIGESAIKPDLSWVGRVLNAYGRPLDGKPLPKGHFPKPIRATPPNATQRRRLGGRLETGFSVLNTFLPIVRGQRIGLFAGSGVGKSTLLAQLAQRVAADYVVIAMIGERGREVREFVEDTLGPEGLKKAVVVAATSDQSPIERRRAAWTAMAIAEFLRSQGAHVLFLADSLTRFCDAHREIAVAGGEAAALDGYPASTSQTVMGLCERAGPGPEGEGDITAIFSVLVAGSDMEEPVADLVRGVLDGHVILDRAIAERGRFPAIDVLRSVSRSFDKALDDETKSLVAEARSVLATYKDAELMIQAGLYKSGADTMIDKAIMLRPKLETFLANGEEKEIADSISHQEKLAGIIRAAPQKRERL